MNFQPANKRIHKNFLKIFNARILQCFRITLSSQKPITDDDKSVQSFFYPIELRICSQSAWGGWSYCYCIQYLITLPHICLIHCSFFAVVFNIMYILDWKEMLLQAHKRRIYKEAKANYHRCFLGENGSPHASIKICVADELIKGGQGENCGGIFVYYIFCYKSIGFPSNGLPHSSK